MRAGHAVKTSFQYTNDLNGEKEYRQAGHLYDRESGLTDLSHPFITYLQKLLFRQGDIEQ